MANVKQILIIFVIAILFSIFTFTLIDAVYPQPDYNDFCDDRVYGLDKPIAAPDQCEALDVPADFYDTCDGDLQYVYDSTGCATSYECNTCREEWEAARADHALVVFIVSAIMGLIAIAAGVYLPAERNPLNEWVGTGFMFGGLISIFVGTAMYFDDMHRVWRPVVIFVELALVLWLAYKKLGKK